MKNQKIKRDKLYGGKGLADLFMTSVSTVTRLANENKLYELSPTIEAIEVIGGARIYYVNR
tara:strand:+ start:108 stop:290 length:183 start_codon:yes stop_codon:yes gene_type:complete